MTATARFGTFDAERWWRPADLATLPAAPGGAAADDLDELLAAGCSPGDLLLTRRAPAREIRASLAECGIEFDHHAVPAPPGSPIERAVDAETLAGRPEMAPYAVLRDTVALAARLGRADRLPAAETVAEVNSKTWSHALVRSLGLPGAGVVVRSAAELAAAVGTRPSVVKDPYGVSGRATLEVTTPGVLRAVTRTLEAQKARVELLVQPRFDRRTDFSAHLRIDAGGRWETLGVQVMHNRGFRHAGSGPAPDALLAELAATGYGETLAAVAEALSAAGYRGPAGVDAMVLADGTLVPVLEINARQSPGLLSLLLDRRVRPHGLRCHLWRFDLKVPPGKGIGDLFAALHRLRYRGGTAPGVAVVGGSGLAAPGGRIYCALMARPGESATLRAGLLDALSAAGMEAR
ncbi:hypothetical protein G3I59_23605 [Amycolatopsis rubida]|uniref:ATP-grasp domain-containing protein n=1 Tax=Amycolatopsis rubida TaxID=112413 RepID=A0ABX0BU38_9PSEU|nr:MULTISPECIES: hypothetical protein [Amycolatopsis]MYW93522.1 hypothetical protein [Amycolatopsis rubida]NEC58509.1 hypothetical protein [Amycolatopsis rubida]OAP25448.1 [Butirosin acyl-carrier protein]--L-glutamate ligase [Amycolatopsis sp. M39]